MNQSRSVPVFTAAELFAGGGGLAVGLRRAGVTPVSAVELNKHAAATFRANHPDVHMIERDIRKVSAQDLRGPNDQVIDILAACPPCQGFTPLTAKYKRDDERNMLINDVSRLAEDLQPTAVMLENVPGLAKRGKPLLDALIASLEGNGYVVEWDVLQVADYGVPQTRRRLVLLAGKAFRISLPTPTHDQHGRKGLPKWRTLRDVISDRCSAEVFSSAKSAAGDASQWHVVRKLGTANLERLRHAAPGAARGSLPDYLRPACHKGKDAGFSNTYGRMSWDQPSVTITAGCLSPSKGRFGHPEELRTISLREAATLQTFPEDYKFLGERIDAACSIVGNALPCLFAEVLARQVTRTIDLCSPWIPRN